MTEKFAVSMRFVALVALLFSLVAMSIDSMLPALGQIASDLHAYTANSRQHVLTAFFAGLTVGQLVYGPVSDSTGRKPAIVAGIGLFVVGGLMCSLAASYETMIVGRVIQGFGAAGPRIVSAAMVRDLYEGRAMARVMSFVMAIFILVPILAPGIGQVILLFGDWRLIFLALVATATLALAWMTVGQRETLPQERRSPFSAKPILRAAHECIRNPVTMGYAMATGFIFGAFICYLGTAQQIFQEQYGLGRLFPVYFGMLAASIGIASIVNARLVMRFGMRRLSKLALRAACVLSAGFLVLVVLLGGHPPFWMFMVYMFVNFFFCGLLFGNYNALAMEPMGRIAGVASAIIGSLTSLVALVCGTIIGQLYDGTVIPLVAGFAALGICALAVTEWAERNRPSAAHTAA
ncbi:MAG: multidrug effflux MFS transporter [Rhizobiales bacterium]|nr:multidrug effflux MFS transporter [Hyphomicrobiales bacterium]